MEVKINKEIRNYTESMFFGLSLVDGIQLFNLVVNPPINGKSSLEYPNAKLFGILSHYLLKKFYIRIGYDLYYHLCSVMFAPDIA